MERLKNNGLKGLRFLERYTKTDMIYLTKGGFWLGIGQIVTSASVFILSVIFANTLDPEIYGIYKYILSIYGILVVFTLTGMDISVTQSIARGYDGSLVPATKSKIKWGLVGTLIALIISIYYYTQNNIILSLSFSVVGLFLPFIESLDIYNSLLFGKKFFSTQTKYNTIKNIFGLIIVSITIFSTGNIYLILLAYFVSLLLPNIIFFYLTKKHHRENDKFDPGVIKYGKHLSIVSVIGIIISNIDKILVFQYIGAANLAIYTIAMAPTDQIKGLLKNVNTLAMPKFSQKTFSEIKNSIRQKIIFLGIISSLIVLLYILIAPLFFQIFFPKYLESIKYSQFIAITIIPAIISGFLYTILESQRSTKKIYDYNIYSNVFHIIILLPLIYYLGIWGAILSKLVVRLFSLVFLSLSIKNSS